MGWVLSNKTAFQVRRSLELSVVVAAIRGKQVVLQTQTLRKIFGNSCPNRQDFGPVFHPFCDVDMGGTASA
jgi:hypothetical protein